MEKLRNIQMSAIVALSPDIDAIRDALNTLSTDILNQMPCTAFDVMPTTTDISAGTSQGSSTDFILEFDPTKEYTKGDLVKVFNIEKQTWVVYMCNFGRGKSPKDPGTDESVWKTYAYGQIPYAETVKACEIHSVILRSYAAKSKCDVIVDWGDGEISRISELDDIGNPHVNTLDGLRALFTGGMKTIASWKSDIADPEASNTEHNISLSHKYDIGDDHAKVFTIKIYGKDYWGITHDQKETYIIIDGLKQYTNLMSRALEHDLPIASSVANMTGFCAYAKRLTQVSVPEYSQFAMNVKNTSGLFKGCSNLVNISGLELMYTSNAMPSQVGPLFEQCIALEKTDFRLPATGDTQGSSIASMLSLTSSSNYSNDVLKLLPANGFMTGRVNVGNAFTNMKKLTCSNYSKLASILWEDTARVFTNTSNCFSGCESLDLAQIPTTWGGVKTS